MAERKDILMARLRGGEPLSGGERFKLTLLLAWPSILAQLAMCLMSYIDAAMVGRLGSAQAAAVGLVSSTGWIFGSFCYANSTGFSVQVAHRCGADAFISIHHNAPPLDKDPRSFRYHAIYAWNDIGVGLATALNKRVAGLFGDSLVNNGVPHANFAVTRNPEIPSCLVEVDFISTPEGEIDCWDRERQKRVASAMADGFDDWVNGAAKDSAGNEEAQKKEEGK